MTARELVRRIPVTWVVGVLSVFTAVPAFPAGSISLAKTVGLVAGQCGVAESLTVPPGTPVTYCYTITNTGSVPLVRHTLFDDRLGTLFSNTAYALAPGAAAFFTADNITLAATTTNTATWTAFESPTPAPTSSTICKQPALAIPDNNPAGVDDVLVVATGGILIDLNLSLDVTHTFVGDLKFSVSNGATTKNFFDRPGYTGSGFGCGGDNVAVVANDEGPDGNIESQCANLPAISGNRVGGDPANVALFAAFDGQPLADSWTLNAADAANGDTGTINQWCLVATYEVGGASATDSATVTVQVPCAADVNADGRVDVIDVQLVSAAVGTNAPAYDLNHDGVVDVADIRLVANRWLLVC